MAKVIKKREAINLLRDSDELEIVYEEIGRSLKTSEKRSKLDHFVRWAKKQIDEDRDLRLFSIKLR